MDTKALLEAREQVAELEAKMLEEVREKAALLGIEIGTSAPTPPKQKRKRRTKAEIEADQARMPKNEV